MLCHYKQHNITKNVKRKQNFVKQLLGQMQELYAYQERIRD